jgi:hypothetical protein
MSHNNSTQTISDQLSPHLTEIQGPREDHNDNPSTSHTTPSPDSNNATTNEQNNDYTTGMPVDQHSQSHVIGTKDTGDDNVPTNSSNQSLSPPETLPKDECNDNITPITPSSATNESSSTGGKNENDIGISVHTDLDSKETSASHEGEQITDTNSNMTRIDQSSPLSPQLKSFEEEQGHNSTSTNVDKPVELGEINVHVDKDISKIVDDIYTQPSEHKDDHLTVIGEIIPGDNQKNIPDTGDIMPKTNTVSSSYYF